MKRTVLIISSAIVASGGINGCGDTEPESIGSVANAINSANNGLGAGTEKVTICHIPPGNPDNAHTITVGAPAVPAHLAHGDYLGACEEPTGEGGSDECGCDCPNGASSSAAGTTGAGGGADSPH